MGSFANLGALAGAASGWNEGSKAAEAKQQHKLDQEREERLIQMKNDMLVAREGTQQKHEVSQKELGHAQAVEMQESKDQFSTSEREQRQEFDASEGQLDRESREDIASETRAASKTRDRKFKTGRTPDVERQNEDGSWETVPGVPTIVWPINQVTYEQTEGLGWVAEGKDRNSVTPPAQKKRAEKALYEEPTTERMQIFEDKYGYIPKAAMGAHERYLDSNPE